MLIDFRIPFKINTMTPGCICALRSLTFLGRHFVPGEKLWNKISKASSESGTTICMFYEILLNTAEFNESDSLAKRIWEKAWPRIYQKLYISLKLNGISPEFNVDYNFWAVKTEKSEGKWFFLMKMEIVKSQVDSSNWSREKLNFSKSQHAKIKTKK